MFQRLKTEKDEIESHHKLSVSMFTIGDYNFEVVIYFIHLSSEAEHIMFFSCPDSTKSTPHMWAFLLRYIMELSSRINLNII